MPPKPKFTKEQIVAAALDVIRDNSVEAITAQKMGKQLGTSTRPMFTYFDTVEELRQAATDAATKPNGSMRICGSMRMVSQPCARARR
jgi:AcrR family transcriptional regulator